jgi:hypothetical protein
METSAKGRRVFVFDGRIVFRGNPFGRFGVCRVPLGAGVRRWMFRGVWDNRSMEIGGLKWGGVMSDTEIQGFKKYISRGRAGVPKVSIRKNGQMAFNAGAVQRFELYLFDFVMLYISERKDRVAVKFTSNVKESGLIAIQKRPGNFAFSCRTFLEINYIDWSRTINLDFVWNDRNKIAIFKVTSDDKLED